ncbi:ThiF family adenylyltransferase [Anaeromyxobacter sp. PSR-1]|uniref:ThiF family adenylyltransferase n=1 Tax=unclassified Anaeromyxobacter TaxID=2620896 RepID=UPI0005E8B66E|nr:ThiF family adenylyltransferase [Anaeromyxobacter sp. PSR-1]GAO04537.1 adenylyltransferase and sulfurtransferase MOCS3 [Anaeromyxobacter sp. PSR-1]
MTSLSGKRVLVIGAGGLGGPALLTLAAAGVGRLVLVEDDAVETSNLNRQPLFQEADVGRRKAAAAAARLRAIFPSVEVDARDERFDAANAEALAGAADVVVDGSDNFETKFLANDAATRVRRPLVHAGVLRTTVQLLTVAPSGLGGCLRCLFEAPPPPGSVASCSQAGILGPVAGFAGALLAAEALRLLAGERGTYEGRLFTYELRSGRSRLVLVRKRPGCLACAGRQVLGSSAPAACDAPAAPAGGAA